VELLEIEAVRLVLVISGRPLVVTVHVEVLGDGCILLLLDLLLKDDVLDLLRQSWEVVQVDLPDLFVGVGL
jgi:hypothetical protein